MKFKSIALSAAVVAAIAAGIVSDAAAQTVVPNRGKITFLGGMDVANTYMFRGLRRDDTRMIMWPYVEGAAQLHSAREGLTSVTLQLGSWNSLHTGAAGLTSSTGKLWYEGDVYGTLGLGFDPGISVSATYTAYTSPMNAFSTIKELSFKTVFDDVGVTGVGLMPYALVAFELDTRPGLRQADRGVNAGTYLEVGVAPGFEDTRLKLQFPAKVGLSLNDYYELGGVDHKFGFLSLGAMATVPLNRTSSYGNWNVHGGIEFQSLGDTPEAFNGGDQTKFIAAVGLGFRY